MKNIANRITEVFSDLEFEEKAHTYKVGEKFYTPVSNVLDNFKEEFNKEEKAFNFAKKNNRTVEDVLAEWDNKSKFACDLGHSVHEFGERYFSNKTLIPSNGFEEAVVNFWESLPPSIIPVSSESRMYSHKYSFAGTCDNLFHDQWTDKLIISDYKTNKDLFKNFRGQTLLFPFDSLLDTPYNKYQLQLNLYQILLEDIGYAVSERWIIWLKPNGTFEKYEAQDLTKDLRQSISKLY